MASTNSALPIDQIVEWEANEVPDSSLPHRRQSQISFILIDHLRARDDGAQTASA